METIKQWAIISRKRRTLPFGVSHNKKANDKLWRELEKIYSPHDVQRWYEIKKVEIKILD